ncbi:MAG: ABC transporter substrate-binding protein [Bordetella sp.]|uniref:ABC transporter substrate-binding protein n=1 Tax=Bordetella sp. TaxID=28081 RepID=UPI003F7CA566
MNRTSRPSSIWRPRLAALALVCAAMPTARAQAPHRPPTRPAPAQPATKTPAPAPVLAPIDAVALPDQAPLDKQIETIRKILPQAKRVGLIYDPGEPASVAAIKQLLDLLSKSGMNPVEVTTPHEWDVGPAVRNLIGRVDLVYTIFDDKVAAQYQVVVQTCDQARIPLFTADPAQVRLGAMASLGLPGALKQAGPAAGRTAPHRPVRPERTVAGAWLYLNLDAAARQGVAVPEDVLKSAVPVNPARAANTDQTKNGLLKADGVKP